MTRIASALALALVSETALVATPPALPVAEASLAAPVKVTAVEGITEYRLANGLRVLLFPDPGKPTITVNITYLVGSRNENYGETGMAHLLEHMVFKGTPRHPDIPKELTEHGTRPNGTTSWDRTNYFESFQASEENLRWALDLEADRMVNSYIGIDPLRAAELLKTEMTVVRNEFEMGENSPMGVLYKRVLGAAFDWHNYGKLPIGARSDIENVDIHRLSAFFKTYYQPDNAVLLVTGKFEEGKTLALINERFGPIPRPARVIPRTYTLEPTQDGERQVTVRRQGDIQVAMAGYRLPTGSDPDFAPIAVLAQILGDTPTGRLHKALVETKKATMVFADPLQLKEPSFLVLGTQVRLEASLEEAKAALLEAAEGKAARIFTTEEVDRARQQLLKQVEMAFNDADRVGLSLSDYMGMGDWRLFFLDRDRVKAVTPADVARVAQAYLRPSNRTLGLFIPTAQADRAEIPVPKDVEAMFKDFKPQAGIVQGEAFDTAPAAIEARTLRFTTAAGLKVALIPKQTRGAAVNFRLHLRFGSAASLKHHDVAGDQVPEMLMRGTSRLSRTQISDRFDQLKAQIQVSGDAEGVTFAGETNRENLAEVLKLVVEVLKSPTFPSTEFESLRQETLAGIEQQRSEPMAMAQVAFRRLASPYPKGHPRYVPTLEEHLAELKSVRLEEVQAFHHHFYGASAGELTLVGDLEAQGIQRLVVELLGDWKNPAPYERIPRLFQTKTPEKATLETLDKPNAFFIAGQPLALRDSDPDYPALVLGNFMLGGGFLNSRLATRIRQKEGLSYTVGSQLQADSLDKSGVWVAYAIFAPQNAARLEAAFQEELARVLKEGFTAEEIQAAKKGWLQSQQVSRAQDRELASRLASHLEAGRTLAFNEALESQVNALTSAQILGAMKKWVEPGRFLEVKAGTFKGAK